MKHSKRSISVRHEGLNSKVERLHGMIREREKVMRGMQTKQTAQTLLDAIQINYNYLREHSALKRTPAEKARIKLDLKDNKIESDSTRKRKEVISLISDLNLMDEEEPLTTIVGVKCPDGIVLASDSQATEGKMKTLGVTKIFLVNNFMAVGGSGDADNVRLFIDYAKEEFSQTFQAVTEFREKIQGLTWRLHKKYNVDAKEFLGKDANPYDPDLVVGVKIVDGNFGLCLIRKNGIVYPVNEYVVIGSGGDLARLVIKQVNRSLSVANVSLSMAPIEHAVRICCYIINEVKDSDSKSGGKTNVVIINPAGVRELSADEVKSNYDIYLTTIAGALSPLFGQSIEDVKRMWPSG